jgi:hypothetical protein
MKLSGIIQTDIHHDFGKKISIKTKPTFDWVGNETN